MKFGEYLINNRNVDWVEYYLDYHRLKDLIRALHDKHEMDNQNPDGIGKGTSLSVPPPTNAAAQPISSGIKRERGGSTGEYTQESFYEVIELEMKKIETFTKSTVRGIRQLLINIEQEVEQMNMEQDTKVLNEVDVDTRRRDLKERTQAVGKEFLKLEKFVNLNFTGFHKILKKHDRW